MSTLIGVGTSIKLDSLKAGQEAARLAYYKLNKQAPDIIIAFISTIFNQIEAIRGIRSIIKETPLVGCSSAGSISAFGALRNSIAVCAIKSSDISFSYGVGNNISKNPRLAGMNAVRASSTKLKNVKRGLYLMFSDGLSGKGTDALRGAQEILGTSFPIIGGAATDDFHFQKTYQYLNNIYTDSIVGILMSGKINVGIGGAHGWQPIGRPHKITRAESSMLKEIDRRKAVELYEEYLSKSFDELKMEGIAKLGSHYPLGVRMEGKKQYLIRAPIKMEDNGNLMLTTEIPEREYINLMIGDKNLALEATKRACTKALGSLVKSKIKFAIVFSDIARLKLLKKDSQSEVEIIKDILGKGVPFFGCYTCGEYAPLNGQSYFHNQAISVAVFSE
ncbi:FIST signal transduction protein [Candidatus Omnitrophota bacterium]